MSLTKRLLALMRWRGIHSQNQLARITGVPQSCIHRILTRPDGYSPSRRTLLRLAQGLETSVPWLTDGVISATDPHGVPPGYGHAPPASPEAAQAPASAQGARHAHAAWQAAAPEIDGFCAEICVLLRPQPDSTKKAVLSMVRLMVERQAHAC